MHWKVLLRKTTILCLWVTGACFIFRLHGWCHFTSQAMVKATAIYVLAQECRFMLTLLWGELFMSSRISCSVNIHVISIGPFLLVYKQRREPHFPLSWKASKYQKKKKKKVSRCFYWMTMALRVQGCPREVKEIAFWVHFPHNPVPKEPPVTKLGLLKDRSRGQ